MAQNAQDGLNPAITPRTRARARHILDHYYIGPSRDDTVLEIWGYTPRMSYAPGDRVALHVSTTASEWDLEIGRDGRIYQALVTERGLLGHHRSTPMDCSVNGCGWPVSYEFTIPEDWAPGGYLVTFRARRGDDMVEEHHLFLLHSAPDAPPPYVLVCATGTWLAYNCWGGSNHYEGITGPDQNAFAPVVSTQRPWSRGFCKLPDGAPRALTDRPPRPGDMVRYPYMEWAYAYGYSKKYASAGWASYERHFARWAESEGYEFDVVAQHDLESDPDLLKRYACAVFVGHDEYWTAEMRDAVEDYADGGGRVARFAGNFLWQTRIEDEGRKQICYKHDAERDPFHGSAQAQFTTAAWEVAPVNRPGALTFGVNGLQGIYAGLGNCVGNGPGGFTVYRPDHWAFEGASIGYGDVLGSSSRIYGYEVDGLDFTFADGLPYPTCTDGAVPEITILAMGLATNIEVDHGVWGETLYIGADDAAYKARAMFGDATSETIEACRRGNGMMISWPRGKGEVFTAATCEWVAGLLRKDPQVEQVTRNVLNRFAT
ncbi:MAG: N,N-dimethylformamidase beta subunit family domain-containing protein [Pseudomonadota bacterium]